LLLIIDASFWNAVKMRRRRGRSLDNDCGWLRFQGKSRQRAPCGVERPLQQGETRLKTQQTKVIETSQ
jgi:hypothetical protein